MRPLDRGAALATTRAAPPRFGPERTRQPPGETMSARRCRSTRRERRRGTRAAAPHPPVCRRSAGPSSSCFPAWERSEQPPTRVRDRRPCANYARRSGRIPVAAGRRRMGIHLVLGTATPRFSVEKLFATLCSDKKTCSRAATKRGGRRHGSGRQRLVTGTTTKHSSSLAIGETFDPLEEADAARRGAPCVRTPRPISGAVARSRSPGQPCSVERIDCDSWRA